MESIDLAMGDIFDGGLEEEDLAVPPPLPDLDDDTTAGGEHDGALNAGNSHLVSFHCQLLHIVVS